MARKEPKLRPSFSQSEMMLLNKALYEVIDMRVRAGRLDKETVMLATLREYVDTFQPSNVNNASVLAMYGQGGQGGQSIQPTNQQTFVPISMADIEQQIESEQHKSCLDNPELTDEEKYDLLSLSSKESMTEREIEFFNVKGFAIRMARMTKSQVKEGDL